MTIAALAFDPYADDALANPFAHHAALRDAGAVVWLERYGCFGMARYAEVRAALTNWETFISGRGVGLSDFAREVPWRPVSLLLETDPPLHSRTRGIMNKVVSLPALRALQPAWQDCASELVARLVGSGPFDAVPHLAEAFPLAVFPQLVGLRDGGDEHLIAYGTAAFNAFGPRNRLQEQSLKQAESATAWVMESCGRDRLQPGGLGEKIFAAADRGECDEAEAERLVRSLLTAGVDTTVNAIANLIHALAEHPDQWRKLREQPELARKAIEESLRWGGVIQTFFRTTSRAVEVAGTTIPEGCKVLLFLAAANRDPRHWNEPDCFDITRSASGHVGFGFGIHQCLGQMVARFEAEAVLAALIEQVAEIRLAAPSTRRINNTLFALGTLPVELISA